MGVFFSYQYSQPFLLSTVYMLLFIISQTSLGGVVKLFKILICIHYSIYSNVEHWMNRFLKKKIKRFLNLPFELYLILHLPFFGFCCPLLLNVFFTTNLTYSMVYISGPACGNVCWPVLVVFSYIIKQTNIVINESLCYLMPLRQTWLFYGPLVDSDRPVYG